MSDLPDAAPGAGPAEQRLPRSFLTRRDGRVERDVPLKEITAAIGDPDVMLWLDIDSSQRSQYALLEKLFRFHPLTLEDVLNPMSRPKVDQYDQYLFVTLRVVRFVDETTDPYDLETTNLYFFIGPNYLVTAHAGPSHHVDELAGICLRTPDVAGRGAARLAHQLMDSAIDAYFPILDKVDDFLDSLEERVFASFDEGSLRDIFAVKRLVLTLRRYLAPQREIFNILSSRPSSLLTPELQLYFRDVYDHMLRINDSLDTYRDLLSTTMESYLSQVSNRLNLVTKGLTVVATLSVPFVVVSGMWGMNFTRSIPLTEHEWGFEIMLVLQIALGAALIGVLRWRKWL